MKLTKLIFAAGVVMLLGIGCGKTNVTQNNANTNKPAIGTSRALPASGTFTVAIGSTGEFDPVTSYVKVGTAITFVNNTDKPHSIVPLKDAGKQFDKLASKTIAAGGKYTVTMDQEGRWLFSDGTNPAFGGAIEVAP